MMKSPVACVQNLQQRYIGNRRNFLVSFSCSLHEHQPAPMSNFFAFHDLHVSCLEFEVITTFLVLSFCSWIPASLTHINYKNSFSQVCVATLVFYPPLPKCFHLKPVYLMSHYTLDPAKSLNSGKSTLFLMQQPVPNYPYG